MSSYLRREKPLGFSLNPLSYLEDGANYLLGEAAEALDDAVDWISDKASDAWTYVKKEAVKFATDPYALAAFVGTVATAVATGGSSLAIQAAIEAATVAAVRAAAVYAAKKAIEAGYDLAEKGYDALVAELENDPDIRSDAEDTVLSALILDQDGWNKVAVRNLSAVLRNHAPRRHREWPFDVYAVTSGGALYLARKRLEELGAKKQIGAAGISTALMYAKNQVPQFPLLLSRKEAISARVAPNVLTFNDYGEAVTLNGSRLTYFAGSAVNPKKQSTAFWKERAHEIGASVSRTHRPSRPDWPVPVHSITKGGMMQLVKRRLVAEGLQEEYGLTQITKTISEALAQATWDDSMPKTMQVIIDAAKPATITFSEEGEVVSYNGTPLKYRADSYAVLNDGAVVSVPPPISSQKEQEGVATLEQEAATPKDNTLLYLGIGAAVILGGAYAMRRKR